ncbi:hypothetical protein [Lutibacter sp. B1]|uniref:DUF7935 family protein n=1 Tax=Lutibacter sp. B1 TaxID=2725996 RepID=UPI001456E6CE|nr:hypothetical protein [Lutibacter sp. B1]NLP58745.1 hypothetical protein [Lutibacter sp. B1]
MDIEKIIDLLSYTIPSIITGLVAYYFFVNHTKNEERKMQLNILKENSKHTFPIKLQAYERMTLFLERINPSNLLLRVTSVNNDKFAYTQSLINTIEQEFEHNIAQQIYISEKCWNVIIASKNSTIHIIKKTSEDELITNAQELREAILKRMLNSSPPSTTALAFIKDEVRNFI